VKINFNKLQQANAAALINCANIYSAYFNAVLAAIIKKQLINERWQQVASCNFAITRWAGRKMQKKYKNELCCKCRTLPADQVRL